MTGYVFDDTVLLAYAHGSAATAGLIAHLADRATRVAVPAAALAAAKAQLDEDLRDGLDGVIDNMDTLALTGLSTFADTSELADILAAAEEIDWPAAHIVAVARHLDWEIITHDSARWQAAREALPWPLPLVVLSDDD